MQTKVFLMRQCFKCLGKADKKNNQQYGNVQQSNPQQYYVIYLIDKEINR